MGYTASDASSIPRGRCSVSDVRLGLWHRAMFRHGQPKTMFALEKKQTGQRACIRFRGKSNSARRWTPFAQRWKDLHQRHAKSAMCCRRNAHPHRRHAAIDGARLEQPTPSQLGKAAGTQIKYQNIASGARRSVRWRTVRRGRRRPGAREALPRACLFSEKSRRRPDLRISSRPDLWIAT